MKLEVGQFVRTKDGKIGKYFGENAYEPNKICIWTETTKEGIKVTPVIDKNTIVKVSYNIIDILEVGDIISFYEDIDNYKKLYAIGIPDLITLDEIKDKITNDNIRLVNILTKEKMEQMAYKVEE